MASLSISMEPITDCSASTLWGRTLFNTASSNDAMLSFSFLYVDLQRSGYLRMQLHRYLKGTERADRVV